MKKAFTAILAAAFCAAALHAGAFELETVEPLQTDLPNETETESVLSAKHYTGNQCSHRRQKSSYFRQ